MKAVIPAAGHGTRFLPATKNSPKEMLPLLNKPTIQYVVEEAVASGCEEILILTGRGKGAIEDHFDRNLELEQLLHRKGDTERLREMRAVAEMADIHFIRQREALGLGHAILCARSFIRDEPFAVLLGDDVVFSPTPCLGQLRQQAEAHPGASIIAVERVPPERISSYGVVAAGPAVDRLAPIRRLVEKPSAAEAPSDLGILGRYILTPSIFDAIARTPPGRNGEIQLTDALQLLQRDEPMFAYAFEGKRYDLGNLLEWLKTNVEVALMQPELREPFLEFLERQVDGA